MATNNLGPCLKIILSHEGGFVDHPDDPGGATNLGITKATYERWMDRPVSLQEIKDLTVPDVEPIYREFYWNRLKGDSLPIGVDLMVFDFGVNSGTRRSAKYIQAAVGSPIDGAIGPNTLRAINELVEKEGAGYLIKSLSFSRTTFLKQISTFDTFGRGWMRRVEETTALALAMLDSECKYQHEL
jgi:lysozyme family protein